MIPGRYDITVHRDTTYVLPGIASKDPLGAYVDFEATYINVPAAGNGKAELNVYPVFNSKPDKKPDPIYTFSTGNGRIVVVSPTVLKLILTSVETTALPFTEGFYELELFDGNTPPLVDQLLYGKIHVSDRKPL